MPLFQQTILQKYLKTQDQQLLTKKWRAYKAHFFNPKIQENIKEAKEEQYQRGFFTDLFVKILGYKLNPMSNYTLTTELKNIKDSKKADGGILANGNVLGVIELKDTNTTDLSKVESQAFGYKNNHRNCSYVIISNFEKLRFYIDNAVEHIELNLFRLSQNDFNLLYLCLAYENIAKGIPKKLKQESISKEDTITKELYNDYSLFKRKLFQNLSQRNPQIEPLELYKKSQKLLDRFLFLFFAEDKLLLPANSVRLILNDWNDLKDRDVDIPLYNRFKKYFEYLNLGYKGKRYDVFPYNGGLFAHDEILNNLSIDDQVLYEHTFRLATYDFDSEVDVNILGHIFENSLNEIEEVQARLKGKEVDKSKTKRKKEGVYYTPKYITKYIVENTLGKICEEKKKSLDFKEEDYTKLPTSPRSKKKDLKAKEALLAKLNTSRTWLLKLTVLDPACGSGAFLNEALNFLIAEHKYIDELETKLLGGSMVFPNIEKSILENNLFGVDLNEESVEIAKLSLWLRTAQKGRKLTTLSNNIKCGNSLVSEANENAEKAFNWQKEIPQIFQEKKINAYHITFVTHNSRTSQRMIDNKVKKGDIFWMKEDYEVVVAKTIKEIIEQDGLKVLAYNSCGDHIHLLLVCEKAEIQNIVRKIKGKSSQRLKEYLQIPKEEKFTLWAQKFSITYINSEKQLLNTIKYIHNNRRKHELPINNGLKPIVISMTPPSQQGVETHCDIHDTPPHNKGLQPIVNIPLTNTPLAEGGFDVVLGNPPYVRQESIKELKPYLKENFTNVYAGTADLFVYFFERGISLLKDGGYFGFIVSNKFIRAGYGRNLRKYLQENFSIQEIIDQFKEKVFTDATVDPCIILIKKTKPKEKHTILYNYHTSVLQSSLSENGWVLASNAIIELKKKIEAKGTPLKDWNISINYGIKTGYNKAFIIDKTKKDELIAQDPKSADILKPILRGRDIKRYQANFADLWLVDTHNGVKNKYEKVNIDDYPAIKNHLDNFKDKLQKRQDKGDTYYNLRNCAYHEDFEKEKIVYPNMSTNFVAFWDKNNYFTNQKCFIITGINATKYLTLFLNSKLNNFYFKKFIGATLGKTGYEMSKIFVQRMFVPNISTEAQQPFIEKTEEMLSLHKRLQQASQRFIRSLQRKFPEQLVALSTTLKNWHERPFTDFVIALAKKKISLSLAKEADWEEYFLAEKEKVQQLTNKIKTTDHAIDQMVYSLYGLTKEEINSIENNQQ